MKENAAVVEKTVETAVTETTPVVNEMINVIPPAGKQALIIGGSALAGIGVYLLVTKVVVPKSKEVIEKHSKKK